MEESISAGSIDGNDSRLDHRLAGHAYRTAPVPVRDDSSGSVSGAWKSSQRREGRDVLDKRSLGGFLSAAEEAEELQIRDSAWSLLKLIGIHAIGASEFRRVDASAKIVAAAERAATNLDQEAKAKAAASAGRASERAIVEATGTASRKELCGAIFSVVIREMALGARRLEISSSGREHASILLLMGIRPPPIIIELFRTACLNSFGTMIQMPPSCEVI